MRKTMNIWVLIAMSACVLVAFFWYSGTLSQSIDELNDTYDQTQMRLTELQGEQADLKTQLETVGTDAFIENQARTMYGYMMPDDFVQNTGSTLHSYQVRDLTLYFANENGDHLVKETRRIHYSSNVPLERVIIEKLLEGPKSDGMLPTLSSNTRILGVSIVEGICYVNLDKSFLTETMSIQQELPIYSIVDSLTDACKIHGVQISVEGDTKVTFRESMELDQVYQADYSYLETEDES